MTLLRRPEVGVLLAIVIAGLIWVVVDQRSRDRGTSTASVDGGAAGLHDFAISRADMVVDGSHRRLRLEFTARHEGSAPLEVRSPAVRLLDASGHEVPAFFAPGAFPPALPPGSAAASWVEFWLTESQAAGPLTLDLAGHQARVPSIATGG